MTKPQSARYTFDGDGTDELSRDQFLFCIDVDDPDKYANPFCLFQWDMLMVRGANHEEIASIWWKHREAAIEYFIAKHPGTRPHLFWLFDFPRIKPNVKLTPGVPQIATLARTGLLTPRERRALPKVMKRNHPPILTVIKGAAK